MTATKATSTGERSADLSAMFAPRGIAVVGASRTVGKLGATMARSLSGFARGGGRLALVNSRDETMYPSVAAATADGPVDLAILCVPAQACPDVLAEAASAGVTAAVVCGGGFAEAGGAGLDYQRELEKVVEETGIRLLGPNTSGFLAPHIGLTASFVPGAADVRAGDVAVVAASGGVNHAVSFLLAEAGHGVSLAVGLGNGVDVTTSEVLDHLAGDAATSAVAVHIESVADGPRLVESVRNLVPHRPVAALVVGQHDVGAFAESHTGALATSWRTTRAALRQAGAVVVDDEREMVDAVGALAVARARPRAEAGVGVVTAQAGPGLLLLDDLRGRNVRVPELTAGTQHRLGELLPPMTFQRNPVDTGRPGPELADILTAVAADADVDVIAGYALHEPDAVDLAEAVRTARTGEVPVVLGVGGAGPTVAHQRRELIERGVAVAPDARGVAAATSALVTDARARAAGGAPSDRVAVPSGVTGDVDEHQAKELLGRMGIATPPRTACQDRGEAHAALAALGGPVAVKLLDAAVRHKTEVGGVHLGIRTAEDLDVALDALERGGTRRYLLEAMAPAGVDLVLGARRDPVFGPIVLLGLGGTTAEALADVAIRLAPVEPSEAAGMPDELAGAALLRGWRGGPTVDPAQLGHIAASLGQFVVDNPGVDDIEINPLRLTHDGLVALDAVIVSREVDDAQPDQ